MQNLLNDLVTLLEQDDRLVVDGKLLKNKVVELALGLDSALIKLLLKHEAIKKHFFQDVDGIVVFDKIKFQKFVSNKSFLPDSYTSFRNKIGLTINDEYLTDAKEVVLVWPYKDCVLEGGQDKEDAKRVEVFWNETLAPDQVDRLLSPKVLTNFARYSKDGKVSLTALDENESLIVKGNNLLAMHTLKEKYAGQVKLIYIDPPYNTDRDTFQYNDTFNCSTWLTFMSNRLRVAKELLSDSGAIFVQISDVRVGHLKLLLDEIFDEENFINQITVRTKSPSGFKTVNLGVFETAEYILVYGKNKKNWVYTPQYVKSDYDENYRYIVENKDSHPDSWVIKDIESLILAEQGLESRAVAKKKLGEDVFKSLKATFALEHADQVFRFTEINDDAAKETVECREVSKANPGKVFHIPREGFQDRYVLDGKEVYFYSNKIKLVDGVESPTMLLTNIWTDIAYEGIANEGGVKLKKGKKPERLLKRIIEMSTKPNDLIMDFHLGSGTTCAVAHKLNRRFIGIEQLDYGSNDAVVRLQNVINGDASGISKPVNWKGGGSFIYCELMTANQKFFDCIKSVGSHEQLLSVWEDLQARAFISYRVSVTAFNKAVSEFSELSLDDQKRFLIEVLDKNMLYVPLSEMDDETFSISNEVKQVNRKFFKLESES